MTGKHYVTGVVGGGDGRIIMDAFDNTDWALNSVSVVEVLSGHNDLSQPTSAQQPTFDYVNETIIFDGTDDNMIGLPP